MGDLGDALRYPFTRFKGFWNYYWFLIPLLGGFIFYGYLINTIRSIYDRKEAQGLPRFSEMDFGETLLRGVFFWLSSMIIGIGFYLVLGIAILLGFIIYWISSNSIITTIAALVIGLVFLLFVVCAAHFLIYQYADTLRFKDIINIKKSLVTSFGNFGGLILLYLKTMVIVFFYTIPAMVIGIPLSLVNETLGIMLVYFLYLFFLFPLIIYTSLFLNARFYQRIVLERRSTVSRAASKPKVTRAPSRVTRVRKK